MLEQAYKEVIGISTLCCHPGYRYVEENRTCSFDSHYPHLRRAHPNNKYVYLDVSIRWGSEQYRAGRMLCE